MSHHPNQRITIPARRNSEPPPRSTDQEKRNAAARRELEYQRDLARYAQ